MVVATHGPVTADGVRRLGIEVDVVSARSSAASRSWLIKPVGGAIWSHQTVF
jgi:uroporphyrinogen-III synthase